MCVHAPRYQLVNINNVLLNPVDDSDVNLYYDNNNKIQFTMSSTQLFVR